METIDLLVACIRKLGGEGLEIVGVNTVDFTIGGVPAFARVQDGGRMRGSVFVDIDVPGDEMDEAIEWADQQDPEACRVDAAWTSESRDVGLIRLLFERDLDPERIAADDPLRFEAESLFDSWYGDEPPEDRPPRRRMRADDPTRRPPSSAWLLMGGGSSYPTQDDIEGAKKDAAVGIYEDSWTAAKQTEPGDLLFFYFYEPDKAIHFVARAVDHAYFEDIGPTGERWSGRQWWAHITPMIEIEPVPLAKLRAVTGDTVMLGRSGRYLRPEHAAALADQARVLRPEDAPLLTRVLQPVTGRPDHPDPSTLNLAGWRKLTAGAFAREDDVSRLVVEPLLRMVLEGRTNVSFVAEYHAGHRLVDYVVLGGSRPLCAIEVKLRVRKSATGAWSQCPDFVQAADYSQRLGVPAILIDSFNVHLIPVGAGAPSLTLSRSVLLEEDLTTVRNHILGG